VQECIDLLITLGREREGSQFLIDALATRIAKNAAENQLQIHILLGSLSALNLAGRRIVDFRPFFPQI